MDQVVYCCVRCGGVLTPDDVLAPFTATPTVPAQYLPETMQPLSAVPTAPVPVEPVPVPTIPVPPGLRRRTISMPNVAAVPASNIAPAPTPFTLSPPAGVSVSSNGAHPVVAPASLPPPPPPEAVALEVRPEEAPPPAAPAVRPLPAVAVAAHEDVTLPQAPLVVLPPREEVTLPDAGPPVPRRARTQPEFAAVGQARAASKPTAPRTGIPGLVWLSLILLAAGGGAGGLAYLRGWFTLPTFALRPTPPAPRPAPVPVAVAPPVPTPTATPLPVPVPAEPVPVAPTPPPETPQPTPVSPATHIEQREPKAHDKEKGAEPRGGRAEAVKLQRAGYRLLERGDVDGALATFKKAIAINPVAALAYRGLGAAYSSKGNHREAARAYQKYLALNPHAQDAGEVRALIQQLQ